MRAKEIPRVEAGSNTSTVTLRVVGGDEKGSLKSETVKYGLSPKRTRTRERLGWQGPAAHTKDRPVLSSERASHKYKTVTRKITAFLDFSTVWYSREHDVLEIGSVSIPR
jgi:hypothetical protein